jgi:hypothetical protein
MHDARAPGVVRAEGLEPSLIAIIAACTPIRRVRRWVPPPPGKRPTLISGRPSWIFESVGDHAVVTGQRQFEPAAQRQAVDRGGHGLAAGLERAQGAVQLPAGIIGVLQRTAGEHAAGHVAEVGAGAEARGLARGQDRALDGVVGLDALDPPAGSRP